jgi:hypothetical protein
MSQVTFPTTGQVFSSSALTPPQMEAIFQALVLQIFGIAVPPANPAQAYSTVRCGWPAEGQPGPPYETDTCIVLAYPYDDPYSRVNDQNRLPNQPGAVSVTQRGAYTQVWRVHFTNYGPNCFDRARLIAAAVSTIDWVHDWLVNLCPGSGVPVVQPIYWISEAVRPVYVPEVFQKRWWPRADLDLRFNEFVFQTLDIPVGESVGVTLITDTGITRTFSISASD